MSIGELSETAPLVAGAAGIADSAAPVTDVDLDRELELHRWDLTGYCYRMLGSAFEAEDAVQDTFLRAWRSFGKLNDPAALRPWLYRIATNVCMNMLNQRRRRALPMDLESPSPPTARLGAPLPDSTWIQPIPDSQVLRPDGDPADLVVGRDTIRLAFVAALQHLPPRQRAVLILRDVLRWRSAEVADLLGSSIVSVNGVLRRARAKLATTDLTAPGPAERTPQDQELLDRYVDAFERFDIETLVSLLRDDAVLSMPPYELWLRGRSAAREWLIADGCSNGQLLPIHANGSPAFAMYKPNGPGEMLDARSIQVLDLSASGIAAIHTFLDPSLFRLFNVPLTLPAPGSASN